VSGYISKGTYENTSASRFEVSTSRSIQTDCNEVQLSCNHNPTLAQLLPRGVSGFFVLSQGVAAPINAVLGRNFLTEPKASKLSSTNGRQQPIQGTAYSIQPLALMRPPLVVREAILATTVAEGVVHTHYPIPWFTICQYVNVN
jgi:hypothetical protein